jgi:V/A-type H+-transporting ATPase subunit E
MEVQVQELLDRIKSEGVDSARNEAEKIIADANGKAAALIANAELEASRIEAEAREHANAFDTASRTALVQASRDAIIALRQKVEAFIGNIIRSDTAQFFDAKFLESLLPELLLNLSKTVSGDINILLTPQVLKELDGALANRLSKELGRSVEFKPFSGIDAGFRITGSGSSVQYDFSADAVSAILSARVNTTLASCLKDAAIGSGRS